MDFKMGVAATLPELSEWTLRSTDFALSFLPTSAPGDPTCYVYNSWPFILHQIAILWCADTDNTIFMRFFYDFSVYTAVVSLYGNPSPHNFERVLELSAKLFHRTLEQNFAKNSNCASNASWGFILQA